MKKICERCSKVLNKSNVLSGTAGRIVSLKKENIKIAFLIERLELRGGLGGGRAIQLCDPCFIGILQKTIENVKYLLNKQNTDEVKRSAPYEMEWLL